MDSTVVIKEEKASVLKGFRATTFLEPGCDGGSKSSALKIQARGTGKSTKPFPTYRSHLVPNLGHLPLAILSGNLKTIQRYSFLAVGLGGSAVRTTAEETAAWLPLNLLPRSEEMAFQEVVLWVF